MGGLGNPDRAVGGLAVPTPPGVELRPLGRDDFEAALALMLALHASPEGDVARLRARYDAMVADVDAAPFLALADGQPVGTILFRFRRRLNHATFEGWVSDLVVAERFRGRGIGRALLAAVIAEWELRGGHQIMLEVSYDRTAARRLVESLGFVDSGKLFEMAPVRVRGVDPGPGVEIRPARDDDADFDAATRLLAELGRPAPSEERRPVLRRLYGQHVRRTETGSLLALADGVPVGLCSLVMREPLHAATPQAWIPDLIVTEAARGRRIGALLLDAALGESARRGAHAAVLESGHHRATAHELYGRAGMVDAGSYYVLRRHPAG